MAEGDPADSESIGDLFGRLIEDGGLLVSAEFEYYRQIVYRRAVASRAALILAGGGILMVLGSSSALMVGVGLGLGRFIGPVAGFLLAGFGGMAAGGLLLRAGWRRFFPFGKPDEKDD